MKTRWLVIALCGLFAAGPAFSQQADSDRHEETRKLLRLAGIEGQLKTVVDVMSVQFAPIIANQMRADWRRSGGAELDPRAYDALSAAVLDEYRKIFTVEALADSLVPIYEKYFTEEEIRELIRFYESPVGAKMASTSPGLMAEAGEAGLKLSNKIVEWMQTPEFKARAARIIAQYPRSSSPERQTEPDSLKIAVVVPRTVTDSDRRGVPDAGQTPAEPAALDPARTEKLVSGRVRISDVQAAHLAVGRHAWPAYPQQARQAGVEGTVRVEVVIGKNGRVASSRVVSGDPLLAPGAEECVRQWAFRPMTLDGQPVEVTTEFAIEFKRAE